MRGLDGSAIKAVTAKPENEFPPRRGEDRAHSKSRHLTVTFVLWHIHTETHIKYKNKQMCTRWWYLPLRPVTERQTQVAGPA